MSSGLIGRSWPILPIRPSGTGAWNDHEAARSELAPPDPFGTVRLC